MGRDLKILDYDQTIDQQTTELIDMFLSLEKDNPIPISVKLQSFFRWIGDGAKTLLLIEGNIPIGFAILRLDGKELTGQSLYIKDNYRGYKTLFYFIKEIEHIVKSEGYSHCDMICTNERLESFYKKRYKKVYTLYRYEVKDNKDER